MVILSLALLAFSVLAGFLLLALGLPGTWLMIAGILASTAIHPAVAISPGMVAALVGLALWAEVLEFVCGYFGAKRYGVSTPAVWGALAGGLAGALALGALFPIVGAVPGAFLGTFAGAFGVELARGASRDQALRLGYGAFVGRMIALLVKLAVATGMAGLGLAWML